MILEQAAKALAKRLRQTYNRLVYLQLYLQWRWLRVNFPSWREYYGGWK